MDVVKFLSLPFNIRKLVYEQLQNVLIDPSKQQPLGWMLKPTKKLNKRSKLRKKIANGLYSIYQPYIGVFDFSPNLVDSWLEYSLWFRYDAIVLDCLRVNHCYQGTVLGSLVWIFLGGKSRLSVIDDRGMLQSWYTWKEYFKWIVSIDPITGHSQTEDEMECTYFKIDMDLLDSTLLNSLLKYLKKKGLLPAINDIHFIESQNDLDSNERDINETDFSRKRARDAFYNISGTILEVFQDYFEDMRYLTNIHVTNQKMHELIVNSDGKLNPIKWNIRDKVKNISINRIYNLSYYMPANFTQWNNLSLLELSNLKSLDMKELWLPPTCKTIIIENIDTLTWWNFSRDLNLLLANNEKDNKYKWTTYCAGEYNHLKDICGVCNHLKVSIMENHPIDLKEALSTYQLKLVKEMKPIRRIRLQNINHVTNEIIVPQNMFWKNTVRFIKFDTTIRII